MFDIYWKSLEYHQINHIRILICVLIVIIGMCDFWQEDTWTDDRLYLEN